MARQFLRIFIGLLLVGILIVVFGGWLYFAQPTSAKNHPTGQTLDPERLKTHVNRLAIDFYPRNSENTEQLDAAADYIAEAFRSAGTKVEFQDFQLQGKRYRNVIGRLPGSQGKRLILGAHYDSCADTPGADDNASGVAGLIELAHLFAKNPVQRPLEFVAYTLEEPPYFTYGSAVHAKAVQQEREQIEGVVVLEMIGYFSGESGSQSYPSNLLYAWYPSRGNFVALVGDLDQGPLLKRFKIGMNGATPMPVYSLRAPAQIRGVDFSDHRSYWPHGIPAIMVTDTAFYRNHAYHTLRDVPKSLDYNRMAQVTLAVYEAIRAMEEE